jgi:protocatechuate 3,4-dioxygenase beta subunit
VLGSIEDAAARSTLVGAAEDGIVRFDIRLQGDGETAFLDV